MKLKNLLEDNKRKKSSVIEHFKNHVDLFVVHHLYFQAYLPTI